VTGKDTVAFVLIFRLFKPNHYKKGGKESQVTVSDSESAISKKLMIHFSVTYVKADILLQLMYADFCQYP
jgi:hypothetical protein